MNTVSVLVQALGPIFRALLNVAAGWLVARGIWSHDDAEQYVAELAVVLATVAATAGWAIYQKYLSDKAIVKAINEAPPGTPVEAVKQAARTNRSVIDVMTTPKP